jgi:glutathionylspermidine synthase
VRRHTIGPRSHWQSRVEEVGLTYHTLADGKPYWDESAYWEFDAAEINRLEAATAELQQLCLAAGDHILDRDRLGEMHIPAIAAARIRETWRTEPPALYGRMDLAYDGREIKLLEYNADTPTALIEASVAQWYWLRDCFPEYDQFNSLHEKLVAKWKDLVPFVSQPVYFGHDGSAEDHMTITYLRDTAQQAGLRTFAIAMNEIGWEAAKARFLDLGRQPIRTLFKLYPWEWLVAEEFGPHALLTMNAVQWIEPIWKMLWSNKALLAILWELNPNHELLLPAYLNSPRELTEYVRKPLFGREGANVTAYRGGVRVETSDEKEDEVEFVYQKLASLPQIAGNTPVLGSWLIDGEPAGMGIRESSGLITRNNSRFVPHIFAS